MAFVQSEMSILEKINEMNKGAEHEEEKNVKDFDFCSSNPLRFSRRPPPATTLASCYPSQKLGYSFLKRLSKSWQLTKIFQTQLRKSPKTTTKTTMSTSLVHSGAVVEAAAAHAEFYSLFVLNF